MPNKGKKVFDEWSDTPEANDNGNETIFQVNYDFKRLSQAVCSVLLFYLMRFCSSSPFLDVILPFHFALYSIKNDRLTVQEPYQDERNEWTKNLEKWQFQI